MRGKGTRDACRSAGMALVLLASSLIGVALASSARDEKASREGASPSDAIAGTDRLHAMSPVARQLIREGISGSPTLRALVREIAVSDVIVLVETAPRKPASHGGRASVAETPLGHASLRYLGSSPLARFVLVWVDETWRTRPLQVALLAHELQHVVEIARAPSVRSPEDLAAHYRRIGHEVVHHRFETRAAMDVEWMVERELGHASHRVAVNR